MARVNLVVRANMHNQDVRQVIRDLPGILSGKVYDRLGLRKVFGATLGAELMGRIHREFLEKSDGKADSTGLKWKPLAPSTIAQRSRESLTPGGRYALSQKKGKARQKFLAKRKVPILIRSGRLVTSLEKGTIFRGSYNPPKEQIFEIKANRVILGTKVPYAKFVNKKRPLWPRGRKINPWIRESARIAVQGLATQLAQGV